MPSGSFTVYLDHIFQVMKQNNTIKSLMAKMVEYLLVCVLVMDFNMKFEAMKHHKNEVENFVNRGLSWHDALVLYFILFYVDPNVYDIRKEEMFIKHINLIYNKQNTGCVLFIIEAVLNFTKRILSNITRVIRQSDNGVSPQDYHFSFTCSEYLLGYFFLVIFTQRQKMEKVWLMETFQLLWIL